MDCENQSVLKIQNTLFCKNQAEFVDRRNQSETRYNKFEYNFFFLKKIIVNEVVLFTVKD